VPPLRNEPDHLALSEVNLGNAADVVYQGNCGMGSGNAFGWEKAVGRVGSGIALFRPMASVTGIFPDAESALHAGEEVREVAGPRATVRVLLPGARGTLVEVAVVPDNAGTLRIAGLGAAVGVLAMAIVFAFGLGVTLALIALAWGVATGIMLAVWLTGERYPSRVLGPEARGRLVDGQAVVTAVVGARWIEGVKRAIADEGGLVADGFLHEHPGAPSSAEPLPT